MLRLFILLLLVSCSSQNKKEKKVFRYVDTTARYRDEQFVKDVEKHIKPKEKKEIIDAYFDFYSFSLRDKCSNLKFKAHHPKNERLGLPELYLSDIRPTDKDDDEAVYGLTFDLTSNIDGRRYEYFRTESDIEEIESSMGLSKTQEKDYLKIVLLRTGQTDAAKYVICADQIGMPITCMEDKLITQLANINDYGEFCQVMSTRKTSINENALASEVLGLMRRLTVK